MPNELEVVGRERSNRAPKGLIGRFGPRPSRTPKLGLIGGEYPHGTNSYCRQRECSFHRSGSEWPPTPLPCSRVGSVETSSVGTFVNTVRATRQQRIRNDTVEYDGQHGAHQQYCGKFHTATSRDSLAGAPQLEVSASHERVAAL
jgi:hypothetical protein